AVLAADRGLDLHALHFVAAAHGDLHHAAAGFAHHLDVADLGLGLLHVHLHRLGLLHQVVEVASHESTACQALRARIGISFYRTHAVGPHGRAKALAETLHARLGLGRRADRCPLPHSAT